MKHNIDTTKATVQEINVFKNMPGNKTFLKQVSMDKSKKGSGNGPEPKLARKNMGMSNG
jgi:hypothetical protein